MPARSGAAPWFSAWRWRRLRRMPAWGVPEAALEPPQEQALAEAAPELRLDLAGALAAELFIARITKQSFRPAAGAWFGIAGIKSAWPGAAPCYSARANGMRVHARRDAVRRKAGVTLAAACLRL